MVDRITPEVRSSVMRRIRGTDTKPERLVRSLLHRLGYRFRLHGAKLPGRPDIVFARRRKVVFVHGCFWHAHEGCPRAYRPKSRIEFWDAKLSRNRERDAAVAAALEAAGWELHVVWECETARTETLALALIEFLGPARCQGGSG